MADRYKMLPNEILSRGTTFDLYVMDAALSYHNYQQKKAQGKVATDFSSDELQNMIQKVRGE